MKVTPRVKLTYCTTYTLSSLEIISFFFFGLSPRFYLATSGTKWFENQRNCCLKVMAGEWQLERAKIKANGGKLVIRTA